MGEWLRLPGGREYLIGVPGMMATGLSDAQVAEVANWLLATVARSEATASHTPYTQAEVARARSPCWTWQPSGTGCCARRVPRGCPCTE